MTSKSNTQRHNIDSHWSPHFLCITLVKLQIVMKANKIKNAKDARMILMLAGYCCNCEGEHHQHYGCVCHKSGGIRKRSLNYAHRCVRRCHAVVWLCFIWIFLISLIPWLRQIILHAILRMWDAPFCKTSNKLEITSMHRFFIEYVTVYIQIQNINLPAQIYSSEYQKQNLLQEVSNLVHRVLRNDLLTNNCSRF